MSPKRGLFQWEIHLPTIGFQWFSMVFAVSFFGYTSSSHPIRLFDFVQWFLKIGVPQNGWVIMENPIKTDDLGVFPYFWKHLNLWTAKNQMQNAPFHSNSFNVDIKSPNQPLKVMPVYIHHLRKNFPGFSERNRKFKSGNYFQLPAKIPGWYLLGFNEILILLWYNK